MVVGKPGTVEGPCRPKGCGHWDCVAMRRIAEGRCVTCGEEIGYWRAYVLVGESTPKTVVHEECVVRRKIT